jgi:hypothetical protein
MNIDKRWLLLTVAVSAAAGAAVAAQFLRRRRQASQQRDEVADLKAWENEGGNLAPHAQISVMPTYRQAG